MSRLELRRVFRPALRRVVHPRHLWHALRLGRERRRGWRWEGDSRLELLAGLLPGGFLNYGYHEDLATPPERRSLFDMQEAQRRYAERLADALPAGLGPVLDVGCGMGGLLLALGARGHSVVGLTPDRAQLDFLRRRLPQVELLHSRLEDLDVATQRARFAAVITAESLQYLKLERALPVLREVLGADGRWVACDFFRRTEQIQGSGHAWPGFLERLARAGFRLEREQDITAHVLPSLAWLTMWARKLGLPLLTLLSRDLARKRPGLHYLLEEGIGDLLAQVEGLMAEIDPACFARDRTYRLLVLRRSAPGTSCV